MKTNRSTGLRRKARQLHRQADLALAARKVFDAAGYRDRAVALEARADIEDAAAFDPDEVGLVAGFNDADLGGYETVSLNPRDWS